MVKITGYEVHDVRFPTSLTGDGSDAMNTECDYSSAYIALHTASALVGYGMTFTIGRGNDIVCIAIRQVADRLVGKDTEALFANMGETWDYIMADPQLLIGPEKGVIHLASAAVDNALWDMYARARGKPLWKLLVGFTPEQLVQSAAWRYISDAITRDEALAMLKEKETGKKEREERAKREGYPAYVTSAGWLGYTDEKVAQLTKEALTTGFSHFKMKVGANLPDDLRRGKLIRSIIDDPQYLPPGTPPKDTDEEGLRGTNVGPTGNVLMIDANQVWDVKEAVEYVTALREIKPWFIEEPTAPDDVLGHAAIRKALLRPSVHDDVHARVTRHLDRRKRRLRELKPHGIGVATGEHAHNRIVFKQLLQAKAIDVVQIDSCRLAGVSEVLRVLFMAAHFGVPVCPHAGGVGLCEYVIHLSLVDYIAVSGSMERNVLEYVDHLHEHFVTPCSVNERGRYNVPSNPDEGYSIEMHKTSIAEYGWPNGTYWVGKRQSGG